jgi:biopolymer transport protein ExbD
MDEKPFESINVIPFVDIMLVLLTMVLTTATFISTGRIPVSLPQASKGQVEKHQDKTISIAANGDIFLDSQPVTTAELEARIGEFAKDTSILIRADQNVAFKRFVDVADVLKKRGQTHVAVQTLNAR